MYKYINGLCVSDLMLNYRYAIKKEYDGYAFAVYTQFEGTKMYTAKQIISIIMKIGHNKEFELIKDLIPKNYHSKLIQVMYG